jgi:hypothetical protein
MIVLGMWLGVVITKVLFEFTASDADSLRAARAWPLTPLHFVKIGLSLIAVTLAVICTLWVFRRRGIEDVDALLGFRRRIWTLAAVAAAFATPALYLGLICFGRYLEGLR